MTSQHNLSGSCVDAAAGSGPAVVDRLRAALGCDSDAELARVLGVRPSVVGNWRPRGVPPARLLALAVAHGLSIEWLTTGCGEPRAGGEVAEAPADYAAADDPRLAVLLAALADWWGRASADERVWLDVELRRRYGEVFSRSVSGDRVQMGTDAGG